MRLVIGSSGAVAEARISLTNMQRRLFVAAGRQPCPAQTVQLVVDTGASHSFVDESVMRTLGIPPSNSYRFHSASTRGVPDQCMAYSVDLQLGAMAHSNAVHIHSLEIMAGTFLGELYQGLLGRDVLNRMHLGWRGPSGEAVLEYP